MEHHTPVGMNRTGLDMAPLSKGTLVSFAEQQIDSAPSEATTVAQIREQYLHEADGVGSVPLPARLKGVASAVVGKLKGHNPEVLIDKIGERLAYERTGVRLYEALMLKVGAANGAATIDMEQLSHIRAEEEAHMNMLTQCLMELGADPTAMTPCADVSGVAASGHLQVLSDPRTTVPQALNSVLMIELGDNAGWELLAQLASEAGHTEMAERFASALQDEQQHLQAVQGWLRQAVLQQAS